MSASSVETGAVAGPLATGTPAAARGAWRRSRLASRSWPNLGQATFCPRRSTHLLCS